MGNTVEKPKQPCQSSKEQKQEEDVSSFTCEICIEPVSSDKRFKNSKKCGHHSYCVECIEKYIQAKLEEFNLSDIKCPGSECSEFLDPFTCGSFLSAKIFTRWSDVLCEKTLLRYPKVYCPFRDCSCLIVNECGGGQVNEIKCPNCNKWFCYECKIPWLAGHACSGTGEFRDTNDVLLNNLMEKKKWKRCPDCNHGVELRSGCSLVNCRCGTLFCHKCGRRRSKHYCWCTRHILHRRLIILAAIIFMLILLVDKLYVK